MPCGIVILFSPQNWAKPNNTCEANITGAANRTRRKANITEKPIAYAIGFFYGAGDEARTRYLHLGKVALYRMSYTRNGHVVL